MNMWRFRYQFLLLKSCFESCQSEFTRKMISFVESSEKRLKNVEVLQGGERKIRNSSNLVAWQCHSTVLLVCVFPHRGKGDSSPEIPTQIQWIQGDSSLSYRMSSLREDPIPPSFSNTLYAPQESLTLLFKSDMRL
jgi:hypothetical protein